MEVIITETESGEEKARYTINLAGLNYTPAEEEYYSEAWKHAVEDGAVESEKRDKHSFTIID